MANSTGFLHRVISDAGVTPLSVRAETGAVPVAQTEVPLQHATQQALDTTPPLKGVDLPEQQQEAATTLNIELWGEDPVPGVDTRHTRHHSPGRPKAKIAGENADAVEVSSEAGVHFVARYSVSDRASQPDVAVEFRTVSNVEQADAKDAWSPDAQAYDANEAGEGPSPFLSNPTAVTIPPSASDTRGKLSAAATERPSPSATPDTAIVQPAAIATEVNAAATTHVQRDSESAVPQQQSMPSSARSTYAAAAYSEARTIRDNEPHTSTSSAEKTGVVSPQERPDETGTGRNDIPSPTQKEFPRIEDSTTRGERAVQPAAPLRSEQTARIAESRTPTTPVATSVATENARQQATVHTTARVSPVSPPNPNPESLKESPPARAKATLRPAEGVAAKATPAWLPPKQEKHEPRTPQLVIGQIDIIIQAPAPMPMPATAGTNQSPSASDMSSRQYLRRL